MEPVFRLRPGSPSPLGATWDGAGVNFALFSETAAAVTLSLFDAKGDETRLPVRQRTDSVWHVHVEPLGPGQRYAYRVDGPWDPERGLRFNAQNVLLDPYAKATTGTVEWDRGAYSYDRRRSEADLVAEKSDQRGAPLGIVVDPSFEWGADSPPCTPLRKTILYEAHVQGLTARHPDVPTELRGTYLGLAADPIVRHLRELGATALVLLPIHTFVEGPSATAGLRGGSPIGFFAPATQYRSGEQISAEVRQLKRAIKALHAEGIEVIVDVAFDHTAEGNHLGPALSFRGIDNAAYYRLIPETPRYYVDYGSGNGLNVAHSQTFQLVMDSLRYWVAEMHVDGFRFRRASALAHDLFDVGRLSSFFAVVRQDPVIGRVKLIAEPWNVGQGGYQVAEFPRGWAEWNGRYCETTSAFWRGEGTSAAEIGRRLTGSSDHYGSGGRSPSASVNFVASTAGAPLYDLLAYAQKQEPGRDGPRDERPNGSGVDDRVVNGGRGRQMRNVLAMLSFSAGSPLICGGDEIGRTLRGREGASGLAGEDAGHDWQLDDERRSLLAFARRVLGIRRKHPLLQRGTRPRDRPIRGAGVEDLKWLRHDGKVMTDADWANPATSSLGLLMAGASVDAVDEGGMRQKDDDLLLLINASGVDLDFQLPQAGERGRAMPWSLILDTADDEAHGKGTKSGATVKLVSRSLKLLARGALGPDGLEAIRGAPSSTYRLQMNASFRFDDAAAIVDYVDRLGVGAVYSSPYLRAQRGSTHGYDVVDHAALNPEIGTTEQYRAWIDALGRRQILHVLDFVPNHVGIGSGENHWWVDVLENGPSSSFADFFDIEWQSPERMLHGKVLLPVLGRQFGEEVDNGKLAVAFDAGALWVTYYDKRFPASPRSYAIVLERAARNLSLPDDHPARLELESILAAVRHLPDPSTMEAFARRERAHEKEVIKRRLGAVCSESPEVDRAVDDSIRAVSASPERLERFLTEQNYRLSYWRVATDEINYRRFFDINELAAIRMEDPAVFTAAHSLVFDLVADGSVTGLRLDHTDGLYDPQAYFQSLREGIREALSRRSRADSAPTFVIAEKILEPGEELSLTWAISGTSGYDFLSAINALWVAQESERLFDSMYVRFAGGDVHYGRVSHQSKRDVMSETFSGEIHVLGHALKRIAESSRHARDFTLSSLLRAIQEMIAALDVYRTYVRPDGAREPSDEARVVAATESAKRHNAIMDPSIFDFLREVLLLEDRSDAAVRFAMRFQQLTGPIMAKGVEDTALYRYNRLVCLNEVGCDPSKFGSTIADLHVHNAAILARWPTSMTTTTTHDTKRGEDVRARLAVLSEVPDRWEALVGRLIEVTRPMLSRVDGLPTPSRGDVYSFMQAVVGVWPYGGVHTDAERDAFEERLTAYMVKAVHEAKERSSWTHPNEPYDDAVRRFVERALSSAAFVDPLAELVDEIATYGASNSLAQLAIRLASPGVPDVYRGCETWDFSLVDPDNRRPVDYASRRAALEDLRGRGAPTPELARELVASFTDGRIKLHVTQAGLRLRRSDPALFLEGSYEAIDAGEHVVAFERSLGARRLVCVAPRLARKLTRGEARWAIGKAWDDRRMSIRRAGSFTNILTGDRLEGQSWSVGRVLSDFPVAWLHTT